MRTILAATLLLGLVATGHAGSDPTTTARTPRGDAAPRPDLERPAPGRKPVDGTSLCTYVNPDQNAPSERGDCIAQREPLPERPAEKTPPSPPGTDATPSSR